MKGLLLAIQFLTIIPVRVGGEVDEDDIAGSVVWFPLAGALKGVTLAFAAWALLKVFPAEAVAAMLTVTLILLNRGFDLDGLADTADALSVKSTGDAQRDMEMRLRVMKDSTTGVSGVWAVVSILLLKFVFIWILLRDAGPSAVYPALIMMPALSRWVNVPAMLHGLSARADGLGRLFIERVGRGQLIGSTVLMLLIGLACGTALGDAWSALIKLLIPALICGYACALLCASFFRRSFGGLTGDCFGAMTEVSEVVFLAFACALRVS